MLLPFMAQHMALWWLRWARVRACAEGMRVLSIEICFLVMANSHT